MTSGRTHDPVGRMRRDIGLGFALALALSFFVDVAVLVVPIYDMQLYDRVIQSHNMDTLASLSVACVVGLLLYAAVDCLRSVVLVVIADRVARRLHVPVLQAAVRRRAEGAAGSAPDAIRDLNEIRVFLSSGAVAAPLDALCSPLLLAVLFMLHPAYGFLGLCGIAALMLLGLAADALGRPGLVAATQRRAAVANTLGSQLRDAALTEGLGMLPAIARRWSAEQGQALGELRRAGSRAEALAGVARLVRLLLQAGVMVMGALMILAHMTTPGSLMGANLLLNKVLNPFDHLVASWRHWGLAQAAWGRLAALLRDTTGLVAAGPADRRAPAGPVPAGPAPAGPAPAGLHLAGVSLQAGGRTLLRDISFVVPPGTTLGVVGPNGSGKSTLLRLLAGVAEPGTGTVLLDGVPVGGIGGRTGYLPQSVGLLDGSIADNVMRFADADDGGTGGAIQACRDAGVHDLVGRLRLGYDAPAGEAGLALSGGQRQRIGLARALFGSPRLLVLDEPDASLDHDGQAALLRAVRGASQGGAVVVVVTHRPGLLAAMDLRLELGDGGVAWFGPNGAAPGLGPAAVPQPATRARTAASRTQPDAANLNDRPAPRSRA